GKLPWTNGIPWPCENEPGMPPNRAPGTPPRPPIKPPAWPPPPCIPPPAKPPPPIIPKLVAGVALNKRLKSPHQKITVTVEPARRSERGIRWYFMYLVSYGGGRGQQSCAGRADGARAVRRPRGDVREATSAPV